MNTDINNEEYPRLTPPDVVYEHKDALKKNAMVIPLYAKIIAAAAAVALLFGLFWFRGSLPEQELMAELKPIAAMQVVPDNDRGLVESQARFIIPKETHKTPVRERVVLPLLAELQPKAATTLIDMDRFDEPLANDYYLANTEIPQADILLPSSTLLSDNDLSWVGRGIYKITDGESDSFAGVFSAGLQSVKTEMASLAMTLHHSRSQLLQRIP